MCPRLAAALAALADLFQQDAAVVRPLHAAVSWAKKATNTLVGHPALQRALATALWRTGEYGEAHDHFVLCDAAAMPAYAAMLVEWHRRDGVGAEAGHFVARPVLKLLATRDVSMARAVFADFVAAHPGVRPKQAPFAHPLLNFLYFLLRTLERKGPGVLRRGRSSAHWLTVSPMAAAAAAVVVGATDLFLTLRDRYGAHLKADPEYARLLARIGQRYFNIAAPAAPPSLAQIFGACCVRDRLPALVAVGGIHWRLTGPPSPGSLMGGGAGAAGAAPRALGYDDDGDDYDDGDDNGGLESAGLD